MIQSRIYKQVMQNLGTFQTESLHDVFSEVEKVALLSHVILTDTTAKFKSLGGKEID